MQLSKKSKPCGTKFLALLFREEFPWTPAGCYTTMTTCRRTIRTANTGLYAIDCPSDSQNAKDRLVLRSIGYWSVDHRLVSITPRQAFRKSGLEVPRKVDSQSLSVPGGIFSMPKGCFISSYSPLDTSSMLDGPRNMPQGTFHLFPTFAFPGVRHLRLNIMLIKLCKSQGTNIFGISLNYWHAEGLEIIMDTEPIWIPDESEC